MSYRFFGNTTGRKGATTAADWALIEPYLRGPVDQSDIATFDFDSANTLWDKDGEKFLPECITDFAASAPGVPVLLGHDWTAAAGVGRVYQGWTEQRGADTWLCLSAYFDMRDADSARFVRKLESGLAGAVSIGFYAPMRSAAGVYSRANGESCSLLELSLVWAAAQYGAAPSKGALAAMAKSLDRRQSKADLTWILPKELR